MNAHRRALTAPTGPSRLRGVWHTLVVLALGCLLVTAAPCQAGIQTAFEKFLGQQAAAALVEQFGTESDPVLVDWVRGIGERVSAVSPRKDVRYRIRIIEMDEPNAMALPGGYIFVTKGLLEFVQDDDELAAILAHEVGHVAGRHGIRHVKYQILASLLLGVARDNGGDLAAAGLGLVDALVTLRRSRRDELAADAMGAEYAARAGYDPAGLLCFFRKIREPRKPSWLGRLFATHPPADTRIARLEKTTWLKEPPPETLVAIGDRLAADHRLNKALAKYRAAAARRPNDAELAARIAGVLAAQGRPPEERSLGPAQTPGASRAEVIPALLPPPDEDLTPARQAVAATLQDLNHRQQRLGDMTPGVHRSLQRVWRRHQWTSRLMTALVGLPQGLDYRWAYLAVRCITLSAEVDRLINSTTRVTRTAPPAMNQAAAVCALASKNPGSAASLPPPLLSAIAAEMDQAGKESLRSVEEAGRALPELEAGDCLVAAVLADLNSSYAIRWPAHWAHLGTLEGLLQHAGGRIGRAAARLDSAIRDAARAQARVHRAGIDLAAAAGTPRQNAIYEGLVHARLKVPDEEMKALLARGYSLGDAAVALLFARSTSQPLTRLEVARQGNATWIETAEKLGLSVETQAIVLRLLNNAISEERVGG